MDYILYFPLKHLSLLPEWKRVEDRTGAGGDDVVIDDEKAVLCNLTKTFQ